MPFARVVSVLGCVVGFCACSSAEHLGGPSLVSGEEAVTFVEPRVDFNDSLLEGMLDRIDRCLAVEDFVLIFPDEPSAIEALSKLGSEFSVGGSEGKLPSEVTAECPSASSVWIVAPPDGP